jgi:hypothetical protein
VAETLHWCAPSSFELRRRASTNLLPEIVTVPAGLAASPPANAEPSDIVTVTAATLVPATALSGRDADLGANLMPVGRGS